MPETPNIFDVVIVGGGPAGSFCAEKLAQRGIKVALFNGRPSDTPKPCGGGVTSKAFKFYPELKEAVGRTIDDLEIFAPSGKKLYLKLDEPFAIYSRTAFDSFLLERARKAGAIIFDEKVSVAPFDEAENLWRIRGYGKSSDKIWRGKYLAGADGANSPIAKMLVGALPKSEMEVAFGYRAPLPKNESDVPTVVAFLPKFAGYAWAFPRLDHLSFGIATAQDTFNHAELDKVLWSFMLGYYRQRADKTAKIWQDESANLEMKSHIAPTLESYAARIPGLAFDTWDTRKAVGKNWALIGDAAGFADSVTGEGIFYALRSAELFAENYLLGKAVNYEKSWREDFGKELKKASRWRTRFYASYFGAAFTERMIQFANLHGGIKKVLGELVAGEQGYVNLKKTLLKKIISPF